VAGNAFVSGDWRASRWCTVEVSSQRLWCKSVMGVREKCDEKSWEGRSDSWQCGIPPFEKARAKCFPPRLAPKEWARTWGTGTSLAVTKVTCALCYSLIVGTSLQIILEDQGNATDPNQGSC